MDSVVDRREGGEEQTAADPKPERAHPVARGTLEELRRPFAVAAVKFKVQGEWPRGNPRFALIVPYIDSRLVSDRLNAVVGLEWEDSYEAISGGKDLRCSLTVLGTTRRDAGEGSKAKDLHSDAFKRAAVKFGVGVSLYALPKITLKTGGDLLTSAEKKVKGEMRKFLKLTPQGEAHARKVYGDWLESEDNGFGKPIEHGDTSDAVGDADVAGDAGEVERVASGAKEEWGEGERESLLECADELWGKLKTGEKRDIGFATKAAFKQQCKSAAVSEPEALRGLVGVLEDALQARDA